MDGIMDWLGVFDCAWRNRLIGLVFGYLIGVGFAGCWLLSWVHDLKVEITELKLACLEKAVHAIHGRARKAYNGEFVPPMPGSHDSNYQRVPVQDDDVPLFFNLGK